MGQGMENLSSILQNKFNVTAMNFLEESVEQNRNVW